MSRTTPPPVHASTGWFKSSFSNPDRECVEVKFDQSEVHVRDTKDNGHGPVLTILVRDWPNFLSDVINDNTNPSAPLRFHRTPDGGARLISAGSSDVLTYTPSEWTAFVDGVCDGQFAREVATSI